LRHGATELAFVNAARSDVEFGVLCTHSVMRRISGSLPCACLHTGVVPVSGRDTWVRFDAIFRSKSSNCWCWLFGLFPNPKKVSPPQTECGDFRLGNGRTFFSQRSISSIEHRTFYLGKGVLPRHVDTHNPARSKRRSQCKRSPNHPPSPRAPFKVSCIFRWRRRQGASQQPEGWR
jgi:hypothetical protein